MIRPLVKSSTVIPLEQSTDIAQTIAAPLEHFEFVVQPFDTATRSVGDEVAWVKQREERRETAERTAFHSPLPEPHTPQCIRLRASSIKDRCQFLAERVGTLKRGTEGAEALEPLL